MAYVNTVQIKIAYADATSRTIKFSGVEGPNLPDVKDKIIALNSSLTGGTAPTFANTFVSAIGAEAVMISNAKIIRQQEEVIYSAN